MTPRRLIWSMLFAEFGYKLLWGPNRHTTRTVVKNMEICYYIVTCCYQAK